MGYTFLVINILHVFGGRRDMDKGNAGNPAYAVTNER